MGDGRSSLRIGWAIGALLLGLWTLLSAAGAGLCLVSGNLAGFAFGLAWALGGYWFTRGMVERARPTAETPTAAPKGGRSEQQLDPEAPLQDRNR